MISSRPLSSMSSCPFSGFLPTPALDRRYNRQQAILLIDRECNLKALEALDDDALEKLKTAVMLVMK